VERAKDCYKKIIEMGENIQPVLALGALYLKNKERKNAL